MLSSDRFYSDLFERSHSRENAKEIANMITTDVMGLVDTKEKRKESKLAPAHLSELATAMRQNSISRSSAKRALYEMVMTGESLGDIVRRLNLGGVSDASELERMVSEVVSEEPEAVEGVKSNPQGDKLPSGTGHEKKAAEGPIQRRRWICSRRGFQIHDRLCRTEPGGKGGRLRRGKA